MNLKTKVLLVIMCCVLIVSASCSRVAITGRKQFNLVPDSVMNSMSFQSYKEFISTNKLSDNAGQKQMVERVGRRIQKAVEQYCAEQGISDRIEGYAWEFNLVEDEAVNAWAMPGGKTVVYTGLMKIAQDETGLAVVMGHEIAHAVAKHGSERMTQGLIVEMGGIALSKAVESRPDETQKLFMKSYNAGTEYGLLLPYSRVHEKEADHMGLIFMAMAGYNPNAAVDFWERMAATRKPGSQPLEILSTHPADSTRIENLKELIPDAMQYYRGAEVRR